MDHQLFRDLSWNDLEGWARKTDLNQIESYKSEVSDLDSIQDNHVMATVHGSKTYLTEVWFENKELKSSCTCDLGSRCKHAVAVILVLLDKLNASITIPDFINEPSIPSNKTTTNSKASSATSTRQVDYQRVRTALSKVHKEDLIEWCATLIVSKPDLLTDLPDGIEQSAFLPKKPRFTKRKIAQIQDKILLETSLRDFGHSWTYRKLDDSEIPNYSEIRDDFQDLAELGLDSELLKLAGQLADLGTEQVMVCDPPGEIYEQLRDCMTIAGAVLESSELTQAQKVATYWEWRLIDEFDLTMGIPEPADVKLGPDDWRVVANHFMNLLNETPPEENDVITSHRRKNMLNRAIEALKAANAIKEVVELMESELPFAQDHRELVDFLIEIREFERAKYWIVQGRQTFKRSNRDIANELLRKWRDIAIHQNDFALAASVSVHFFIDKPGVDTFETVRDDCQKSGNWNQVRSILLEFLTTGTFTLTNPNWPLPGTGFDDIDQPVQRSNYPDYRELIFIAIAEGRLDDAVAWYRSAPDRTKSRVGIEIAPKIKDSHPEVSLDIWKRRMHSLIGQSSTKAYQEAVTYLKQARDLMTANGQVAEYELFVSSIRTAYKNKRRLMQELDLLEHGE